MRRAIRKTAAVIMALGLVLSLAACGGASEPSSIIIKNASVYTVNEDEPKAEAVVIKDGIIEYVGDEGGAAEYEYF